MFGWWGGPPGPRPTPSSAFLSTEPNQGVRCGRGGPLLTRCPPHMTGPALILRGTVRAALFDGFFSRAFNHFALSLELARIILAHHIDKRSVISSYPDPLPRGCKCSSHSSRHPLQCDVPIRCGLINGQERSYWKPRRDGIGVSVYRSRPVTRSVTALRALWYGDAGNSAMMLLARSVNS